MPPPGRDVVLEIDLQGARQVKARHPDALVVLLVPPSPEIQASACAGVVTTRRRWPAASPSGPRSCAWGRELTPFVVVNDEVDRAVSEVAGILDVHRNLPPDAPAGNRGGA